MRQYCTRTLNGALDTLAAAWGTAPLVPAHGAELRAPCMALMELPPAALRGARRRQGRACEGDGGAGGAAGEAGEAGEVGEVGAVDAAGGGAVGGWEGGSGGGGGADSTDGKVLQDWLYARMVEVPVKVIGGRLFLRLSAHVYNQPADYEVLVGAVAAFVNTDE